MQKVKLKNSEHVNVLNVGEPPIPGELNFLEDEWRLAKRLVKSQSDPESQKSFWKTLKERKLENPGYCLFQDFPGEPEVPVGMDSLGAKRAGEIVAMLRGKLRWQGEEEDDKETEKQPKANDE